MSLGRKSAAAPYGDVEAGFKPFGTGDIGLGDVRAVFSNKKFHFSIQHKVMAEHKSNKL